MNENRSWGAEPVAVSGVGQLVRSQEAHERVIPAAPIAASERFGIADLLVRKGKDLRRTVASLIDGGLSPASPRRVLVVGPVGGVGVSTITALVTELWRARAVRSVILDASGHDLSGLAERVDAATISGNPDWAAFRGYGPAELEEQLAAAAHVATGNVLVAGGRPEAAAVASVVDAAAASWPLVVIDGGSDLTRATSLVDAIRPDALLATCRPSVKEIQVGADWLAHLASIDFDAKRHALGVVTGVPMMRTPAVSSARAALWDVAAGAITVDQTPRLATRTETVIAGDADDGILLIAASIAAARPYSRVLAPQA